MYINNLKEVIPLSKYLLMADDFCDLPERYLEKHNLVVLPTEFELDSTIYANDKNAPNYLSAQDFYRHLRDGSMPKTSALAMDKIKTAMEAALKQDLDVLYIVFSSGLSGTFNNARLAKEELETEYPDRKIFVVDSRAASLGLGLLVHKALELKEAGNDIEEVYRYLEDNKLKFCHYFTVDDLNFLHRGGRVSKATAIVGSVLGIKPVLHVDDEGHLIAIGKVRGRKASLDMLVTKMEQKIGQNPNDIVFISHGDCEADAKYVAEQVRKKFGIKANLINYVGTTIGAHSGPGTLALFFIGDGRAE